jgi:hypothetical protein
MNIKFEDIKPLVEDACVIGNRMICKFRDRKTGQVILSAADLNTSTGNMAVHVDTNKSVWDKLAESVGLNSLLKRRSALKTQEQQAILKAFHKVNNQFELHNGKLQLKPSYHVQDIWKKS